MTDADIAVVVVLGLFTILGFYWGIIRQVLAVVGLVVGVMLAGQYGTEVAVWLGSFLTDPNLAQALGFIAVLLLVSGTASLIASLLHSLAGLMFLGWIDHLLGALLGLAQGLLAVTAVLIVLVVFPIDPWSELVRSSLLAGWLLRLGEPLTFLLPELFASAVHTFNEFGILP
ncbi:CvpA family protein [Chloroflexus sp.]|uniref:CvpA family protein n=1 Tax=Chloroflexus sp. TaxID=1904827 RepID=UPI00262F0B2B|nr:CvpA family protein [uncultured Chloroflexus sp.]